MKPTEALDIQAYFRGKCLDQRWKLMLDSYISIASGYETQKRHGKDKPHRNLALEMYRNDIIETGSNADCFFVKDEMSDLIVFASSKLDSTDEFDLSIVPTDRGFAYFEKPLEVIDIRGNKLFIHLFLWKKVFGADGKMALSFSCWNDAHKQPDEVAMSLLSSKGKDMAEKLEILGRFHWVKCQSVFHNQRIGDEMFSTAGYDMDEIKSITYKSAGLNGDFSEMSDEEWAEYKEANIFPSTNVMRLLWSYFLIMSQTLTEKTKQQAENRAQRKRIEREKLVSEVTIIQFRKRRYVNTDTDETKEEKAVDWSHRWIVGGHWRWQPYKDPKSGGEIKKRIWISPYVKGPEDKPLVAKSKVFVLAK